MTPEEYLSKLDRLNALVGLDPNEASEEGKELSALADELQAYEQATWPALYPLEGEAPDSQFPDDEPPEDFEPGTP